MEEWLAGQQPLLSGNLSQSYVQLKKQAKKTNAGAVLQSEYWRRIKGLLKMAEKFKIEFLIL